ncbi:hypothetical protein LEP1GSC050_0816 [Leptospira broomii serovar Hurstbridge str. 5399]|uniref:Uncharacterized protein n=1 Tax=Leptospira broomii serovar Hurstbridge str. 5399 TaxID=1049789 RepID=T0GJT2_9LEPT|nr:hypothetical protein LEP1GSC050_0816 [Leptospira broomii serovar Hurstbridge str. 5399]
MHRVTRTPDTSFYNEMGRSIEFVESEKRGPGSNPIDSGFVKLSTTVY